MSSLLDASLGIPGLSAHSLDGDIGPISSFVSLNQIEGARHLESGADVGPQQHHSHLVPNPPPSSFQTHHHRPSLQQQHQHQQQPQPQQQLRLPEGRSFFDFGDDFQHPVKPSHDYGMFRQQVGVPVASDMSAYLQPMPMDPFLGLGPDEFSANLVFNGMNFSPDRHIQPVSFSPIDGSLSGPYPDVGSSSSQLPPLAAAALAPPNSSLNSSSSSSFVLSQAQSQPQLHPQPPQQALAQLPPNTVGLSALNSGSQPQPRLSQPKKSVNARPLDPKSEEIISRVINQIRENSKQSHPETSTPPTLPSQTFRLKKDEDDMDEDERLLASEEGKKLSSKQRRQLRNKVSARAFRSRRKEYITHLENEVMAKSAELNETKRLVAQLKADNIRSHNFITLLLRHPAFHPFLEQLSQDPCLSEPVKLSPNANVPPEVPLQSVLPASGVETNGADGADLSDGSDGEA